MLRKITNWFHPMARARLIPFHHCPICGKECKWTVTTKEKLPIEFQYLATYKVSLFFECSHDPCKSLFKSQAGTLVQIITVHRARSGFAEFISERIAGVDLLDQIKTAIETDQNEEE